MNILLTPEYLCRTTLAARLNVIGPGKKIRFEHGILKPSPQPVFQCRSTVSPDFGRFARLPRLVSRQFHPQRTFPALDADSKTL
jgi:hypothetical protein